MSFPYLKEGTFEPGMKPFPEGHVFFGKTVRKWHAISTGPRQYMGFGYYRRHIGLEFDDGVQIQIWEDSK